MFTWIEIDASPSIGIIGWRVFEIIDSKGFVICKVLGIPDRDRLLDILNNLKNNT